MLALHLLQAALVLINSRLVDRVLDETGWAALMNDTDRRGLSPLVLVETWRCTAPSSST